MADAAFRTPFRVRDFLSREEIIEFHRRSNLRGALAVGGELAMIGLALYVVHMWATWWTVLAAIVFVGIRQAALGELTHEVAHGTLFASRRVNAWVGDWICAAPGLEDVGDYWPRHLRHHRLYLTDEDPDLSGYAWVPTTRSELMRRALRALVGVQGVLALLEAVLTAAGLVRFMSSGRAELRDQRGRTVGHALRGLGRRFGRALVVHVLLVALVIAIDAWVPYLVWWIALLTVQPLMGTIRDILEHAGCVSDDPRRASRSLETWAVGRFLYAPHGSAYHTEHHLMMGIPFFRLAAFRRLLVERGALEGAQVDPGLASVLASITDPGRCRERPAPRVAATPRAGTKAPEDDLVEGAAIMPWIGRRLDRLLAAYYRRSP